MQLREAAPVEAISQGDYLAPRLDFPSFLLELGVHATAGCCAAGGCRGCALLSNDGVLVCYSVMRETRLEAKHTPRAI